MRHEFAEKNIVNFADEIISMQKEIDLLRYENNRLKKYEKK